MKINVNSWHYKLISAFEPNGRLPSTLCSYFWNVVFYLIISSALITSLAIVGYLIVWMPIFGFINQEYVKCIPLAMVVLTGIGIYSYASIKEKYNNDPNLFLSFIKAKKDKICPLIEYTKE